MNNIYEWNMLDKFRDAKSVLLFSIVTALTMFLMYVNYTNSFVKRYDIGDNLDDKMVVAISSKYIFNKFDGSSKTVKDIINRCEESERAEECITRYKYRTDTLANYILPSFAMKLFDNNPSDFDKSLSNGIFYGYSSIFFGICIIILISNFIIGNSSYLFTGLSFLVLSISNIYILEFEWHKFSEIFFPVIGDGYFPLIYVPRGSISLLLIPITLSIVYNKPKLILFLLILCTLIHTGYALIFSLFSFITTILMMLLLSRGHLKILYYLLSFVFILITYIFLQSHFGGSAIVNFDFTQLSTESFIKSISLETVVVYFFITFVLLFNFSSLLKKYSIVFLSLYAFLHILYTLTDVNVITHEMEAYNNLSQRMNGSFMYLTISYLLAIVGLVIYEFFSNKHNKVYLFTILTAFLFFINLNFTYAGAKLSEIFSVKFYSYQYQSFKDNSNRIKLVENDIDIYINKFYQNETNLYWLSENNSYYKIDRNKIKNLQMKDIDIDNEFLVFLKLYISKS